MQSCHLLCLLEYWGVQEQEQRVLTAKAPVVIICCKSALMPVVALLSFPSSSTYMSAELTSSMRRLLACRILVSNNCSSSSCPNLAAYRAHAFKHDLLVTLLTRKMQAFLPMRAYQIIVFYHPLQKIWMGSACCHADIAGSQSQVCSCLLRTS